MALEPITRQEQIIAGKDLEPITRLEKFLKEYGGGSLPFGEVTTYGDTLTWDGNTEGRYMVDMGGLPLYLVSEATPSQTHFNNGWGGTVTAIDTGEIGTASSDGTPSNCELTQMGEGCFQITIFDEFLFIIPTDNYSPADGTLFPKKGIYATCSASGIYYLSSLTINGYNGFETKVVKPIDNKYLEPFETVGGDTLTWDGNTEGLNGVDLDGAGTNTHYLVSNATPSIEELSNGVTISTNGESITAPIEDTEMGLIAVGGFVCFVVHENAVGVDVEGLIFPKAGIYLSGPSSLTINGYTGFTTTKLKEEYIPVDYIKQLIAEVTGN